MVTFVLSLLLLQAPPLRATLTGETLKIAGSGVSCEITMFTGTGPQLLAVGWHEGQVLVSSGGYVVSADENGVVRFRPVKTTDVLSVRGNCETLSVTDSITGDIQWLWFGGRGINHTSSRLRGVPIVDHPTQYSADTSGIFRVDGFFVPEGDYTAIVPRQVSRLR